MGNKYLPKRNSSYTIFFKQKYHIEKNYSYLNCNISNNQLVCYGKLQPNEFCEIYKVKIIYNRGYKPKVFIIEPKITYNDDIHLYTDNSLCLFHPTDLIWNDDKIIIANTIIPWISEWIIFYEIWKVIGKWLGDEVKHTSNK